MLIRDEEWLVRSAAPMRTGGHVVRVVGLSELVRNHEARFLTTLDDVTEIRPEETALVPDDSPQFRRSRLYLDALLRRTPPTDDRIYLGHRAAINYAPFQTDPAHMALGALRPPLQPAAQPRVRRALSARALRLLRAGLAPRIRRGALRLQRGVGRGKHPAQHVARPAQWRLVRAVYILPGEVD